MQRACWQHTFYSVVVNDQYCDPNLHGRLFIGERSAGRGSLATTQMRGATLATHSREAVTHPALPPISFFIPSHPYPLPSSIFFLITSHRISSSTSRLCLSCCALDPYEASTSLFSRGSGRATRVGGGGELVYIKDIGRRRGGMATSCTAGCKPRWCYYMIQPAGWGAATPG